MPEPDFPAESLPSQIAEASEEDVALYILDMLIGVRHLAKRQNLQFLAYLVSVAVEEARILSDRRSAATAVREQAAG